MSQDNTLVPTECGVSDILLQTSGNYEEIFTTFNSNLQKFPTVNVSLKNYLLRIFQLNVTPYIIITRRMLGILSSQSMMQKEKKAETTFNLLSTPS